MCRRADDDQPIVAQVGRRFVRVQDGWCRRPSPAARRRWLQRACGCFRTSTRRRSVRSWCAPSVADACQSFRPIGRKWAKRPVDSERAATTALTWTARSWARRIRGEAESHNASRHTDPRRAPSTGPRWCVPSTSSEARLVRGMSADDGLSCMSTLSRAAPDALRRLGRPPDRAALGGPPSRASTTSARRRHPLSSAVASAMRAAG